MSSVPHAWKRHCRASSALLVAALAAVLLLLAPATPASASITSVSGVRVNGAEARLVRLLNAQRVRAGLPALRLAPGYTDVARRWSRAMAARHTLVHNPRLAASVSNAGGRTWRAIGENVAFGYRPETVFTSFMGSAPHRANIMSGSYRYVGVGWVETGGRGYTTLVFANAYSSSYGPARVAAAPCRF